MEKIKIGINGLGRIGRMILRAALEREDIEVVGINDLSKIDDLIYLLKYDTPHGPINNEIHREKDLLVVSGKSIRVTSEPNPMNLKWNEVDATFVIDATGLFLTSECAKLHLYAGAKFVVMSAPPKDETPMFVCGVNLKSYSGEQIVSNASCTTNCLAPLAKVLNDQFGILEGLMTTIHPVTATQCTVDSFSKRDYRAGRASGTNIIPYTTGAAKSIGKVIPDLNGRLTGICFRIPTLDVSAIDLTVKLNIPASMEDIRVAIKTAAETNFKGIIGYTQDLVVSSDFMGEKRPCVFDAKASIALNDSFVKIIAWYDNEIGYSNKLLDLIRYINSQRSLYTQ